MRKGNVVLRDLLQNLLYTKISEIRASPALYGLLRRKGEKDALREEGRMPIQEFRKVGKTGKIQLIFFKKM